MNAMIDEIFGIKLFGEFELPLLRSSSNARFASALFCSCNEDAQAMLASKNEQLITAVTIFIRILGMCGDEGC